MFKEINTLRLFLDNPSRDFNVREAARLLKISPATASKNLKALAEEGLLSEKKERMLILYKANLESRLWQDFKVFYNIHKIRDSGLIDALNKFYVMPAIAVFGSSACGTDIESDELDFLVVSKNTRKFSRIQEFEKVFNKRIRLFAVKHVKDLKDKLIANNAVNGLMVQGEIKWC